MKRLLLLAMLLGCGAHGATYTNGQLVWLATNLPPSSTAAINAVATDHSGNVFVAGAFNATNRIGNVVLTSTNTSESFIAKYTSAGALALAKDSGGTAANGIAIDSQGNIIIVGTFRGTANFGGGPTNSGPSDSDAYVAKYSPSGAYIWASTFGSGLNDSATAVAIDSSDNIIVTAIAGQTVNFGSGITRTGFGSYDVAIAKFSGASGATMWGKLYGGPSGDNAKAVTIDRNGDVLVTGSYSGGGGANWGGTPLSGSSSSGVFLAKYAAVDGSYIWSRVFTGSTGNGVAADPNTANIFITGQGSIGFFLNSYDSSGAVRWAQSYGTGSEVGYAIAVDGHGNVVLTGNCGYIGWLPDYNVNGSGYFLANFTTAGTFQWAVQANNANSSGSGVAFDSVGYVLAGGSFTTINTDFGGIIAQKIGTGNNLFLGRYANTSSNPFTFSPSTYSLAAGASINITVTYTAPSDSSTSSNALIFTDNGGGAVRPIQGGPPGNPNAPSNVHINSDGANLDNGVTNSTGTALTLVATNTGASPFTYWWRQNLTVIQGPITGPAGAIYSTNNAQVANNGWYDVIVSNTYGVAFSTQVYVQLTAPPISAPGIAGVWTNFGTNINSPNTAPFLVRNISLAGNNKMIPVFDYSYSASGNKFNSFAAAGPDKNYLASLLLRTNYYITGLGALDLSFGFPTPLTNASMDLRSVSGAIDEGGVFAVVVTNAWYSLFSGLVNQPYLTNALEAPVASFVTNGSSAGSDVLNVPSSTGELVIDALVSAGIQFTQYPGQTLLGVIFVPSKGTYLHVSSKPAIAGTTSMGWGTTISGDTLSHIAVSIKGTPPPQMLVQPAGTNIPLYAPFSLSAKAEGSDTISYRWKKNVASVTSTNLSGTTSDTLSFNTPSTNDSGIYTVLVTNQVGSVMSYPAMVNIYTPPPQPVILIEPSPVTTYYGSNITFGVFASGTPSLLYQWRHNSNIIVGANSPAYSKSNVSTNDQGWYDVQIANSFGNTSSVPVFAALSPFVNPPTPKFIMLGKMNIRGKALIR